MLLAFLAYIAMRKKAGVANKTVNLETGVLRGVLKRAKRWHLVSDEIKPLPVRHQVGRALSPEEKLSLQQAARKNSDWENARLAMTLALNTTMRACEVKGLQWKDVDFLERTIIIRHSKTDAGRRLIPLKGEAFEAIMELYHRAQKAAGTAPDMSFRLAKTERLIQRPRRRVGARHGGPCGRLLASKTCDSTISGTMRSPN